MAKRKRNTNGEAAAAVDSTTSKKIKSTPSSEPSKPLTIQIIAGSYDRVLHGITATLTPPQTTTFTDTFVLDAQQSALKTLAISPPSLPQRSSPLQKVILATGSNDERIQLYHLSAHPPSASHILEKAVVEDPGNRELGVLVHHSSAVTNLCFPNRSKLLSSSEDSTIAVTRTRDWNVLSTIKAPIPKPVGRPSGDTAPIGGTPAGVNDFAVHSSLKLMISVSKGERNMRLWNLLTGKKAGVLNFGKDVLQEIGEGRFGSGEGRKVVWGCSMGGGEEFCVGFDRGAVVWGMDSLVRCKVMAPEKTKIHQIRYIELGEEEDMLLAVSTEDGRILFFSTRPDDLIKPPTVEGKEKGLPSAKLVAQLGGKALGVNGRIKDFVVLTPKVEEGGEEGVRVVVEAGSDGSIRVWKLTIEELLAAASIPETKKDEDKKVKQVGTLCGTLETRNRITCLAAFVMIPRPDGAEVEEEIIEEDGEEGSDSDSE